MNAVAKTPNGNGNATTTETVFRNMLRNVQSGEWPVGSPIPSERSLIGDFGVSRIAVREALSMLRGLGVLDIGHGRRTLVRKVDSETFAQLLPLMLASSGQESFDRIFEVRLALETASAHLAATRRTEEQLETLWELVSKYEQHASKGSEDATALDLQFHLAIAQASDNPLFPVLLESLSAFVFFVQKESCRDDEVRLQRAIYAHQAITEAIADRDAERARVEMEAHLRYSAARKL